jgi:hypothetical protein
LEETKKEIEEDISDRLARRIINGKLILDKCQDKIFKSVIVEGKTLIEWSVALNVRLPVGDNDAEEIEILEHANAKLASSVQKAEEILAIYEFQTNVISDFHDEEFAIQYVNEMTAKGKKKLAAEKIRQLVLTDKTVDSSLSTSQAARAVTAFFKRIISGLEETRRAIDNRVRLLNLKSRLT